MFYSVHDYGICVIIIIRAQNSGKTQICLSVGGRVAHAPALGIGHNLSHIGTQMAHIGTVS